MILREEICKLFHLDHMNRILSLLVPTTYPQWNSAHTASFLSTMFKWKDDPEPASPCSATGNGANSCCHFITGNVKCLPDLGLGLRKWCYWECNAQVNFLLSALPASTWMFLSYFVYLHSTSTLIPAVRGVISSAALTGEHWAGSLAVAMFGSGGSGASYLLNSLFKGVLHVVCPAVGQPQTIAPLLYLNYSDILHVSLRSSSVIVGLPYILSPFYYLSTWRHISVPVSASAAPCSPSGSGRISCSTHSIVAAAL